jgi:hypothetical protein
MSKDLIERDSVIKILHIIDEKLSAEQCDDKTKQCMYKFACEMLNILQKVVNAIPRANEESVRFSDVAKALDEGYEKGKADRPQGKWVDDGDTLICSNCKTAYNHPIFHNGWNYCPNCGTRMKEVDNE